MSVVCIAGMHRSGTSLVSRVVNLLGVNLGPEDEMIVAGTQNPAGFWENARIKDVNERILEALGGQWDEPPLLEPGWPGRRELEPLRCEASEVVRQALGTHGPRGWKDPRNSLTLPFWCSVTEIDKVVVVIRDPRAVVKSLSNRNGFDPEKSAALWIRYTVDALRSWPDPLVVTYEVMLERPEAELSRLQAYLGFERDSASAQQVVADAVKPHLNRASPDTTSGPRLQLASGLYELVTTTPMASLREVLDEVGAVSGLRQRLDRVEQARGELEEANKELANERVALERDRERLWARHSNLRGEYAAVKRLQRDAQRRAEELAAAHRQQEGRVAALEGERDSAVQELEQARQQAGESRRRARAQQERRQIAEAKYRRLAGRRSVRLALKTSALARPLFQAVRRLRKRPGGGERGQEGGGEPVSAPDWHDEAAQATTPSPELNHQPRQGTHPTTRDARWLDDAAYPHALTVIVPIYNAVEHVKRCIDSVVMYTTRRAELLLVDDGSDDPAVGEYLATLDGLGGVRVTRNRENLGFVRTVNWAFEHSRGDVIVLNSDTEVGPRWVENLMVAAYSDPRVASATPLSDHGGAFAVDPGREGAAGFSLSPSARARAVTQESQRRYPEAPTANGFCMYLKREALDSVGYFDAERFPRGYGEENDWSMRARELGWTHVVDDATLVTHAVGASFGEQRQELVEQGRSALDSRHPTYTQLVEQFKRSDEMATVRATVADALRTRANTAALPRILFVSHKASGGTAHSIVDLVDVLQHFEAFVLYSDTEELTFGQYHDGELVVLERWPLETPLRFGERSRREYRAFVADVVLRYGIELLHVRHLIKHTLDVPDIAARLGLPLILSFHDYYFVCPTVHLLDERDQFCGGVCTPTQGRCRTPTQWLHETPHLKHGWVHVWQRLVDDMLQHVDVAVTTSEFARRIHTQTYSRLCDRPFRVIPHGRDLEQAHGLTRPPERGGPIRILVPGHLGPHKGVSLMRSILDCDAAKRIEFHLLGDIPEEWRMLGIWHGEYLREQFESWVATIRPAFVGVFSIWGETYVHTVTEAWAAGVPVLATNMGALTERIEAQGGGWLLDPGDPQQAYERIIEIADDSSEYEKGRALARIDGLPSRADMCSSYERVYEEAMRGRRTFQR